LFHKLASTEDAYVGEGEYTTVLLLTALLLSLLLAASVVFVMVQEGVATIWRMSRETVGEEGRLRQKPAA
jgi:hypothetical protein